MKYIILLLFFINALNAEVLKIEEITIINTNANEKSPFLSSDESLLFYPQYIREYIFSEYII